MTFTYCFAPSSGREANNTEFIYSIEYIYTIEFEAIAIK